MQTLCFKCKGRNFCGRGFCAIRQKIEIQRQFNQGSKKEFSGENYNVFVGRFGYPNINVGLLNIDEPVKKESVDNPLLWSREEYDINAIIRLRSNLINSNFKTSIKGFSDRFTEISKEVSLAARPVDVEIALEKKPEFKLTFNQEAAPFGPSIKLEKARITENTKIPDKVERVVNDDLSAREGLSLLYEKGFDEHYLTKVFSLGNLGNDANKRIVPTRWSITAVDDTLGKGMIAKIKDCKTANYSAYFGGYLGNYYLILTFPEPWSYELFETLVRSKESMHDWEDYYGRKQYAYETAGGYYAARFSILQKLANMKRQAAVLALRFVTDDYWAPLGVWVVRSAAKKSMDNKPIEFNSKDEMLEYAKKYVKEKFDYDLNTLLKQSKILRNFKKQRKISEFF